MNDRGKYAGKAKLLIAHLLTSRTITEAAQQVGVSEATARRWMSRPKFRKAWREARASVLEASNGRLNSAVGCAVDALTRALASETEAIWVKAAAMILTHAVKYHEQLDLLDRVQILEAQAGLARMDYGWIGRSGIAGIAVLNGRVSGGRDWVLASRDFDSREAYAAWRRDNRRIADCCPTVATRRGVHVWLRLRGLECFIDYGKGAWSRCGTDGELRAKSDSITRLPPTRFDGGLYRWVGGQPYRLQDFPVLDLGETGFLRDLPDPRLALRQPATGTPRNPGANPQTPTRWLVSTTGSSGLAALSPAVREAVLRCLPLKPQGRNARLLKLARSLMDIAPGVPADAWMAAVREWWQLALLLIRTQDFKTTWADFRHAWGRAEVTISHSVPHLAIARGVESAAGKPAKERLLAGLRSLAAEVGQPFSMSTRQAGEALGMSHEYARQLLLRLEDEGKITCVDRGIPDARLRVATTYRLGPVRGHGPGC